MENQELPKSYYSIIPANVRYDETLVANAKLMYGEITALSNQKGFCYASNNYFAQLYKVTPQAISKWINQLASKEYIAIEYIQDGKTRTERRIYIVDVPEKKPLTKREPKNELEQFMEQNPGLRRDWDDHFGDRMQKLVFIGQHLDKQLISTLLDACLTD